LFGLIKYLVWIPRSSTRSTGSHLFVVDESIEYPIHGSEYGSENSHDQSSFESFFVFAFGDETRCFFRLTIPRWPNRLDDELENRVISFFEIPDIVRERWKWIILEIFVGFDWIDIVICLPHGTCPEGISCRFNFSVFLFWYDSYLGIRIIRSDLLRDERDIFSIGHDIKWYLSFTVDELERYLGMIEKHIKDALHKGCLGYFVDTLVEDRHNPRFFLEIFFGFLLFVEFGIGPREWHPHIHELARCIYLICETDEFEEEKGDDDEEDDIDDIGEKDPESERWTRSRGFGCGGSAPNRGCPDGDSRKCDRYEWKIHGIK